jgi:glycosyltransferase 2 family protein
MMGAHHSQPGLPRWVVIGLRWVAALAVLAVLLYFLPLGTVRAAIGRVPASRFVVVLLGYLLVHAIGVVKWRMVVNAAGAELDLATSAQCYMGGLFGTLFLPSIVGGDAIRLAVGLRRSPRPAAVLAGNVVDRSLDVAAQAGLVVAGLLLLPGSVPGQLQGTAKKMVVSAGAGLIVLVVIAILLRRALLGGRSIRFRRRLARLRHAMRSVSRRPHVLAVGWLTGTFVQMTFLALTALLAISCGLVLPLRVWLFAWPLAKLAAVLPLTQGGIGVREAALVALLVPFGAAAHLVLAAGLVWEGIVIAGGVVAGGVALLLRRGARSGRPGLGS